VVYNIRKCTLMGSGMVEENREYTNIVSLDVDKNASQSVYGQIQS
jgi:hypothetical protein